MDNYFQNHPPPSGWKDFQIRIAEFIFRPQIYPGLHFVWVGKTGSTLQCIGCSQQSLQECHNMGWGGSSLTSNSWVPPTPLPSTVDGSPSPLLLPASLHAYLSSPDIYSATVAIHFSFSWRDMPFSKLLFFSWQNIFWSRKQQKLAVQSPKGESF